MGKVVCAGPVPESELDIVDSGTVTALANVGTNALNDYSKNWAANVHKNRLVRIVSGAGAGQMAPIESNNAKTLIIRGSWLEALDTTSQYVILGVDIAQVIREVLGGGLNVDLPAEFSDLKAALAIAMEAAVDSGTATGGSNTTIVDTSKNWQVDMWVDAVAEVVIDGVHYLRLVTANTADTITINALPGGVACTAGSEYSLKRPVTTVDVTDRAARLLGVVQSLTQWGGTALTGRDISLDLKALTDDSIKGILKSIGDIAALENLITRIGQTTDAIVAAGATGSISAKLRRVTQGLEDLKTLIVLAAGTNIIGKVGIDQTTPGTTDRVTANLDKISGTAQTAADWTPLFQNLDIALSALRDALRGTGTKDFSTLETDVEALVTELAKKLNKATTPTKYALTITNADTEYSQALPANTKQFSVHLRDMSEFRLAYETGKVATPTDPYETVPAGSEKYVENIEPSSLTLYIAAPAGSKVAEIEAWA